MGIFSIFCRHTPVSSTTQCPPGYFTHNIGKLKKIRQMFGNPSFLPPPISMAEKTKFRWCKEVTMCLFTRRTINRKCYITALISCKKIARMCLSRELKQLKPFKHVQITLLHTSEHFPQALSLGTSQYNF